MTTRATVEDFLSRVGDGDGDKVAEIFADSFDWNVLGYAAVPTNKSEIAEFFATQNGYFVPEKTSASITAFVVEGDDAVVTGERSQTVKATGKEFTTLFAMHVSVADGKVTRYNVYEDTQAVAQAFA